tara:strand:- start:852 stop:1562 length:711 start_codon:yes stop_codon:yes gene_type:complete
MKSIDICYTPLDVPEPPEYSVEEVKQWIIKNTDELQECVKDLCSRGMAAQEVGYKYPWRLVFAYWDEYGGWLNDFDKKFPELSKYMHEAFSLKEDELESILLLPMNNDVTGYGFWHNDGDKAGYRMYLNYENFDEDSLLLRKTKEPCDNFRYISETHDDWDDSLLQKKEYKCKMIKPNQCFFLNNHRSAHATYTEKKPQDIPRIAVIINPKKIPTDDSLVVNSAKKYKDYAIMYYE